MNKKEPRCWFCKRTDEELRQHLYDKTGVIDDDLTYKYPLLPSDEHSNDFGFFKATDDFICMACKIIIDKLIDDRYKANKDWEKDGEKHELE